MTTQYFKLDKLNCPSCVMHLEGMEDDLRGVDSVNANFQQRTMKVIFDESITTAGEIMAAVSAMGYVAIPQPKGDNDKQGGRSWTRFFHW